MWFDDDAPPDVDLSDDPARADLERRRIRCRVCETEVSSEDHVFVVDQDTVGVFVNQHGFAHEVVTVRSAWNVVTSGAATTEFTWFPGYAWRHLLCASCGHHLGWTYTAVAGGRPARFHGLRTAEIDIG